MSLDCCPCDDTRYGHAIFPDGAGIRLSHRTRRKWTPAQLIAPTIRPGEVDISGAASFDETMA